MASASSPDLDVTQDGNKFHFKLHSLVQTKETDFSVGEEFEETQQNGVVMKVTPSWDGNKLVLKYEPKDADSAGKPQTHTRELDGEELILVGEITAKRIFKKTAA